LGSSSPVSLLEYSAGIRDRMALPLGNPNIRKSLACHPESPLKKSSITKSMTWEQIEIRTYHKRNSLEFQDIVVLVETHGMAIMDMNQCDCRDAEIRCINRCDYLVIGSPIFGNTTENCTLQAKLNPWRIISMRNSVVGLGRKEIFIPLHRPLTVLVQVKDWYSSLTKEFDDNSKQS
jgi:hypothetical protein